MSVVLFILGLFIFCSWIIYTLNLVLENDRLRFKNKVLEIDVEHYYRQYKYYQDAYVDEIEMRRTHGR